MPLYILPVNPLVRSTLITSFVTNILASSHIIMSGMNSKMFCAQCRINHMAEAAYAAGPMQIVRQCGGPK